LASTVVLSIAVGRRAAAMADTSAQPAAGANILLRRFSSGLNGMHSRLCYA